ncbi:MAG: hypothetical protein H7176_01670, partial [Bdellovibrionales bacterium]|nr:hypothetical protein [Massilia sp.]
MATTPSGLTKVIVGFSDLFSKRAWPGRQGCRDRHRHCRLVQQRPAGRAVALGTAAIRRTHSKAQAFLCTDEAAEPGQILAWFVRRWQIEVTFEEARPHLGMETQRQWSAPAIARTTPAILALYSIVTLAAKYLLEQQPMAIRHAAWYAKDRA